MSTYFRFPDEPEHIPSARTAGRVGKRHSIYRSVGKRSLDLLLVLLGAPFVLPLILAFALFIGLDGGYPFYFQDRVGRGGRIYRMWKLRSMEVDADKKLAAYLEDHPEAKAEWDHSQKLRHDPRITRFGRFLRRSSMDELPQLWNVIRGDMSLVGPRPMMPSQKALYPGHAYYALRPGLTGLWQVSARNESGFAARAAYDTEYEHNLSLAADARILAATIHVVTHGTGC